MFEFELPEEQRRRRDVPSYDLDRYETSFDRYTGKATTYFIRGTGRSYKPDPLIFRTVDLAASVRIALRECQYLPRREIKAAKRLRIPCGKKAPCPEFPPPAEPTTLQLPNPPCR